MLKLDNKVVDNFSDKDVNRVVSIAQLLENWGLVKILQPLKNKETSFIYVLPYEKRNEYKIVHKYRIGNKK